MKGHLCRVLATVLLSALTATQAQTRALEWALSWRTAHRRPDSRDLVVFGRPQSLPVQVLVDNPSDADVVRLSPIVTSLQMTVMSNGEVRPGLLTCEPLLRHTRVEGGFTTSAEDVDATMEQVLLPKAGARAECEIWRSDKQPFTAGRYRLDVEATWDSAAVQRAWWHVVVRQPESPREQIEMLRSEGTERFRRGEFRAAKERFEAVVRLAPEELSGVLGLVGAMEKLEERQQALAVLLQARNRFLDPETRRRLTHRIAVNYAYLGDDATARRLFAENGMPPETAANLLTELRRQRRRQGPRP
jgi:hypothetical protein